ncbi:MAG TPA: AAA family ATPase [Actinocrinis sp.]
MSGVSGHADFAHGLVIGKFYPPHPGHHFLIRTAAQSCRRVTVVVMAAAVESIPLDERVRWLREAFRDKEGVAVQGVEDDHEIDFESAEAWSAHVTLMRAGVDQGPHASVPVDAVFCSEPYGAELARRFDAAEVRLDPARATFAVSGTKVRSDPVAAWPLLEPPVRGWLARRVVVLGAESTGTTTLAGDLADALRARGGPHAMTRCVPEYGRELTVAKLAVLRGRLARQADLSREPAPEPEPSILDLVWTDADFELVAAQQCADEDHDAALGGPILVCDTDALATTVWQERYVGAATDPVRAVAAAMKPRALYILTGHEGVPFEDDGMRDGEHLRPWMTGRFRELLADRPVPWIEVAGDRPARLRQALAAVDALLAEGWGLADPLG